jgi:hydroxyacylglutathione hydrolase
LQDNYIFLLQEHHSKQTIVVDPGDATTVLNFLRNHSFPIEEIWVTHHHRDHVEGVKELKTAFSALVRGSAQIPGRIPELTTAVTQNTSWALGEFTVQVLELPGHTHDHLAYWVHTESHSLLFSGDVLFGLGCGRLFEGSFEEMFSSLQRISALPPETHIFCTHEYTQQNLEFSLVQAPDLEALSVRATKVRALRRNCQPTVPLRLSEELQSNLFMRSLMEPMGLETFKSLREARNVF